VTAPTPSTWTHSRCSVVLRPAFLPHVGIRFITVACSPQHPSSDPRSCHRRPRCPQDRKSQQRPGRPRTGQSIARGVSCSKEHSPRTLRNAPSVGGIPPASPLLGGPGRMKLKALVQKPENIARFLKHLGEPTEPPPLAPARAPPYWHARQLRHRPQGADRTVRRLSRARPDQPHASRPSLMPHAQAGRPGTRLPRRPNCGVGYRLQVAPSLTPALRQPDARFDAPRVRRTKNLRLPHDPACFAYA
jgi:hypothetical protein